MSYEQASEFARRLANEEGRVDSSGAFTLAGEALTGIRRHQLADPTRYPLALVSWALSLGATAIEVYNDTDDLIFDHDGLTRGPELVAELTGRFLSPLSVAINGALAVDPAFVLLEGWDGEAGYRLLVAAESRLEALSCSPFPDARPRTRFHLRERRSWRLVREFLGNVARRQPPETATLRTWAGFCPVPIRVGSSRLNIPIDLGECLALAVSGPDLGEGSDPDDSGEARDARGLESLLKAFGCPLGGAEFPNGLSWRVPTLWRSHPDRWWGVLGLPTTARWQGEYLPRLAVVVRGVTYWLERDRLDLPEVCGVLVAPGLSVDLSWQALVENEAFMTMLSEVRSQAVALFSTALKSGRLAQTQDPKVLRKLSSVMRVSGGLIECLDLDVPKIPQRWVGHSDDATREYGVRLLYVSRLREAEQYLQEVADKRSHRLYLTRHAVWLTLCQVYSEQGRRTEATALAERALEYYRSDENPDEALLATQAWVLTRPAVVTDGHLRRVLGRGGSPEEEGSLLAAAGRLHEALPLLEQARACLQLDLDRNPGYGTAARHSQDRLAYLHDELALARLSLGDLEGAEREAGLSAARKQALFSPPHPELAASWSLLGLLDLLKGRFDQAEERWGWADAMLRTCLGEGCLERSRLLWCRALLDVAQRRFETARIRLEQAQALLRAAAPTHPDLDAMARMQAQAQPPMAAPELPPLCLTVSYRGWFTAVHFWPVRMSLVPPLRIEVPADRVPGRALG